MTVDTCILLTCMQNVLCNMLKSSMSYVKSAMKAYLLKIMRLKNITSSPDRSNKIKLN